MDTSNLNRFLFWNKLSLIFLFLIIIAGGVVRSTGSGMGCPDWPKCFNQYIPPTSESQLPANYKEIYANRGYDSMDFNVYKTYTEYFNRLIGAVTGFIIIITLFFAFKQKKYKILWMLTLFGLLLTGFQGWLGGQVVASNLKVTLITTHMLIAFAIIGIFIITYIIGENLKFQNTISVQKKTKNYLLLYSIFLMIIFLMQVSKGTEVREMVDETAFHFDNLARGEWLDYIGQKYYNHRSFSFLVLIAFSAFFLISLKNIFKVKKFKNLIISAIILVFLQAFTGIILGNYGIPPFFQTLHLILSAALFMVLMFIIGKLAIFKRETPSIKK